MVWLLIAVAHAGYGVPIDGVPNPAERELFVWTNAVRMDPAAFAQAYACAFDEFEESEKTPKTPVLWHDGLGEIARLHSVDMRTNGELSHDSSDGTPFGDRVRKYYPNGALGENIAFGYPTPEEAVIDGWMCSTGHRANIMSPDWTDLGTGISDRYYTQDFGQGDTSPLAQPLSMGAHSPVVPTAQVDYLVNFHDVAPPARVEVLLAGEPLAMELAWGAADMGTYRATVDAQADCNRYVFRAELADGTVLRFPETGEFGFGPCPYTDDEAQWMAGPGGPPGVPGVADTAAPHFGIDGTDDDDVRFRDAVGCGCAHGAPPLGGAWLLLVALFWRRRR